MKAVILSYFKNILSGCKVFFSICSCPQLHRLLYTTWTSRCLCIDGKSPPLPDYLVKWASHEGTYAGHLSKCLNCVKPIFAMQTIMCSFVPSLGGQKNPFQLFIGKLVPCEKLNQRSHSCSVVPSVDKG